MSPWSVSVGDCRNALRSFVANSVDAMVTDPPYGLAAPPDPEKLLSCWLRGREFVPRGKGFMGQAWDASVPSPMAWRECLRVLKPGGHALVFAGSRTADLMGLSLRLAGFEIRDQLQWIYGSGFPKSLNVSKAGAGEAWNGWGTAAKPAHEPVILARKPHDLRELCVMLAATIGASVCQLRSNVRRVDGDSSSSRSALIPLDSARWDAVESSNTLADLCAAMATWRSESELPSGLSIAWSWLSTLDAICGATNTFTTETVSSLTTDFRTLSCSPWMLTPAIIIQVATSRPGTTQHAELAASIFRVAKWRLETTLGYSARATATAADLGRHLVAAELALSPNHTPIILARKPLNGTVAANVLAYGTGGINVDGCRIDPGSFVPGGGNGQANNGGRYGAGETSGARAVVEAHSLGRWPANVLMDEAAGAILDAQAGDRPGMSSGGKHRADAEPGMFGAIDGNEAHARGDDGGPSRFFFCPKACRAEREAGLAHVESIRRTDGRAKDIENPRLRTTARRNSHPTVKPIALMRWLCRLVTPRGGLVLDPFCGSGTTGIAATVEGFRFAGCELSEEFAAIARARIAYFVGHPEMADEVERASRNAQREQPQMELFA